MNLRRLLPLVLLFSGLFIVGPQLRAQYTGVWTGSAVSANFASAGNWENSAPPSLDNGTESVTFGPLIGTQGSPDFTAGYWLDNITFGSTRPSYTFGGSGTLRLSGNISDGGSSNDINFDSALSISLDAGNHDLESNSFIFIQGNVGGLGSLTKIGTGQLSLDGSNTHAGTTVKFGTLEVNGGSITHAANSTAIGQASGDDATLMLRGGGDLTNLTGIIANAAGSTGVATVTGAGSTWTNNSYLYVGAAGDGTLTVTTGGTVTSADTSIGNNFGGVGSVTVTGTGSTLTNSVNLYVGSEGDGQLDILNGGVVTNVDGRVGNNAGGAGGSVNVSGAGSTWTNSGTLIVGGASAGNLDISGQGTVTALNMTIGGQSSVSGLVELANPGSNLATTGNLLVGNNGNGQLRINLGSSVTTGGYGAIGNNAGSLSSAIVADTGSTWNLTGELYVGNGGTGTLYLYNQGRVNVTAGTGTLHLGHSTGGTGILKIGTDGTSFFAGGIVNAATITTGAGTNGELRFATTATKAAPYYLTKDGTAGGTAVQITGPTQVQNNAGYNVLTGANTYTGGTLITGGTLVAGSNTALGSSSVVINGGKLAVASGVTFGNTFGFGGSGGTLAGNGTFSGPLTLGDLVTLSPGNSPGTLNFTGNLILTGTTGATTIEISGATDNPGVSADLVAVTGTLNLSGLTGYTLNVISLLPDNVTPGAVSGLSTTLPASWTIFTSTTLTGFDAGDFTINSSAFVDAGSFSLSPSGNNLLLTFTPVPEPSTYALLLAGLGFTGLAAWRKRRRA